MKSKHTSRYRILLVAEQANPEWVSVPLVGWSHARAICELTDAHIVTQVRNRGAFLRAGLREGLEFTALDTEKLAAPLYRMANALRGGEGKGWTTMQAVASLSYAYFERELWKELGSRICRGAYDLVHRLTPLSPTVSSAYLARRCARVGIPFVWGPFNGGVPWPRGFDHVRRAEKEWLSYFRSLHRLFPGYRTTREQAAALLVGSRDTFSQLDRRFHHKAFYMPENAIDPAEFTRPRTRTADLPLRVLFVGRLVPYKGADIVVEASAELIRAGLLQVTIIGDGPDMPRLASLVAQEGLAGGVSLLGWVEHHLLQDRMVEADVFAFPSIREFGGAVVIEAMATGMVPIVVGYGGPGELVTEGTGFKIPMGSRASIRARLSRILATLVGAPESLAAKSRMAQLRARTQFSWAAKARSVLRVYDWVLAAAQDRARRPFFPMPLPDVGGSMASSATS